MRKNIINRTIPLPFTYGSKRESAVSDYRVQAFWGLATISLVSLVAYIYAINITARNIAERQNLEKGIADISSKLDSLEFSYVEARNNVTLEMAYARGFKEEKSPLFVSRDNRASLTFNTLDR